MLSVPFFNIIFTSSLTLPLTITPFIHRNITTMATENPLKGNLTTLPKPGGGHFGKFYSLPSLNDPRIERSGDCDLSDLLRFRFFKSLLSSIKGNAVTYMLVTEATYIKAGVAL